MNSYTRNTFKFCNINIGGSGGGRRIFSFLLAWITESWIRKSLCFPLDLTSYYLIWQQRIKKLKHIFCISCINRGISWIIEKFCISLKEPVLWRGGFVRGRMERPKSELQVLQEETLWDGVAKGYKSRSLNQRKRIWKLSCALKILHFIQKKVLHEGQK